MPDRRSAPPAAAAPDWTVQTADAIEKVVGTVRDKGVAPITGVARWVVYGLLAAILGLAAFVLLAIAVVRAIVIALPEGEVWAAHVITGGIFTLAGLFLWAKRRPRSS
jgi:hypothetical protein